MDDARTKHTMKLDGEPVLDFYAEPHKTVTYQTEGRVTRAYQDGNVVAEYTRMSDG